MTKPKGKAPVEEAPKNTQIVIDVNDYIRTRDSVVTGLATLQDAIQTLSSAYIKHTNAVLGDHATAAEIDSSLSKLGDNPALLGDLQRAISPAGKSGAIAGSDPANGGKERKKRQHDPNAPKRPLTPFFLYMQTARPIISDDLGPDFAKGAVSVEGTRRWGTMNADDKQLWTNAYKDNLRLYNARMHSYRRGNLEAKDMSDQEAAVYAEEYNVGENSADAQLTGEASATALHDEDAEGEPEREPTPPPTSLPKTPKAKSTRKSKGAKETPVPAAETIVPVAAIIPAKVAIPEVEKPSPDKKRKRSGKKTADAPEESETPKSQPKSSRKKKAKAGE